MLYSWVHFGLEEAKTVSVQFWVACAEHGLEKIFVDMRSISGQIMTMDTCDYAKFVTNHIGKMRKAGRLRNPHLAYVTGVETADPEHFGVTVGRNHEVTAMATADINEALGWLGVGPTG